MPIETDINTEQGIIIHTITGEVAFSELQEAAVKLFSNPGFNSSYPIILDLSRGSLKQLSSADIINMAGFLEQFDDARGTGKSFIVASENLEFGLSRMLQGHMGDSQRPIIIYRSLEEALSAAFANE